MRFFQFIAVAWLTLACTFAPAHAEKRVALVVGNAAYRHADKLANPVNDARGLRDALKNLGFDVTYGEDLDGQSLRRMIGQFADRVGDADVAMVYFAGHGATFGDTPYVVPVDAEFSSLGQVAYELVPVETLIGELRQAKGVRIVILDACRDNAAEQALKRQASRGGPVMRGLAPMKNPGGLIIAYATQYLSTAADDAGGASSGGLFSWGSSSTRHSPFTAALLHNIATPGLDVKEMFFKVGSEVDAATGGRQQPEISISMYGRYVLAATAGPAPTMSPLPPQTDAPLAAMQERALSPKDSFKECAGCPEMVVLPAGSFTMGSPENEEGRERDEGPAHVVTIGKPFAVGKLHVTVDQFAAFVWETGYEASTKCADHNGRTDASWRDPGFTQEGSHPVVCVNRADANAYAKWLAKKTGKPYRLLSEAEWEYAARGQTSPGAYPRFWFGDDEKDLCRYGNGADQKARDSFDLLKSWSTAPCNDGYVFTSPAGHYAPNAFGLYDMFGNASQWTADCYHDGYFDSYRDGHSGMPTDGSAWTTGLCGGYVVRGGGWRYIPKFLRTAKRYSYVSEWNYIGFRVARTLGP